MRSNSIGPRLFGAAVGLGICSLAYSASAFEISKDYAGGDKSVIGYRAHFAAGDEITGALTSPGWPGGTVPTATSKYRVYAEADAHAQAFNRELEVVGLDAEASFENRQPSKVAGPRGLASFEVRLLGKKVVKKKIAFDQELPQGKERWIKEQKFASARFMIGPVPVTVSAGASFEAKPRLTGDLKTEPGDPNRPQAYQDQPYVRLQAGPQVDLAAVASAEAGVSKVLAVGVKNTLSIYKAALLGEADVFFKNNALVTRLVHEKTGIHGHLEAYVELLFTKHRDTIARYGDSTPRRDELWSKVVAFDGSKPLVGEPPPSPPAPPEASMTRPRWSRHLSNGFGTPQSVLHMPVAGEVEVRADVGGPCGKSFARIARASGGTVAIAQAISGGNTFSNQRVKVPAGQYSVTLEAEKPQNGPCNASASAHAYWIYDVTTTDVTNATSTGTPSTGGQSAVDQCRAAANRTCSECRGGCGCVDAQRYCNSLAAAQP